MPRSRSTIESNLKDAQDYVTKLEAELATTQPNELTVNSTARLIQYSFNVSCGDLLILQNGGERNNNFDRATAYDLRDWLNYHFPKENA